MCIIEILKLHKGVVHLERKRLERIVCERLVSNVCGGMEIVSRWGCLPNTDGYKHAEKKFAEKYTLITFSQLEKEILVTWYNELLYKEKRINQTKLLIDEGDASKLYNRISEWVTEYTTDGRLEGVPKEIREDVEKNSNLLNTINEAFDMVINCAKEKKNGKEIDSTKILKATNSLEQVKKISEEISANNINDLLDTIIKSLSSNTGNKYDEKIIQEIIEKKYYFVSNLIKISEDDEYFLDDYFDINNKKVLDNKFDKNELNDEIENLTQMYISERERGLPIKDSRKENLRNKTSESILEKPYNEVINSISIKEFMDKYLAFVEIYDKEELNINNILDYYNIERRYNLQLYINVIPVMVDYSNMKKDDHEEFLRRFSKIAILDNCLFRHLKIREVAEKIADEIVCGEEAYFHSIIREIRDIQKLKKNIVKQMLQIDSLQYEVLKCENKDGVNVEESLMSILDIDRSTLKQLNDIDLEDNDFIENNKIAKKIYKDLKYLLNLSKDVFMESNEYMNL